MCNMHISPRWVPSDIFYSDLYHERFWVKPSWIHFRGTMIRHVKGLSLSLPSVNMPSFSMVIMIKTALAIVKRMDGWSWMTVSKSWGCGRSLALHLCVRVPGEELHAGLPAFRGTWVGVRGPIRWAGCLFPWEWVSPIFCFLGGYISLSTQFCLTSLLFTLRMAFSRKPQSHYKPYFPFQSRGLEP